MKFVNFLTSCLLEDVLDTIKKKYNNKISDNDIEFYHDKLKHKSQLEWVVKHHIKGDITRNNIDELNNKLDLFRRNKDSIGDNDINKYDVNKLSDTVSKFTKKDKPNIKVIYKGEYNNQPLTINMPLNHQGAVESAKFGNKKANWCTAAESSGGEEQFNNYNKHGNLYNIQLGNNHYQYNKNMINGSENYKDERDQNLYGHQKDELLGIMAKHATIHDKITNDDEYRAAIKTGKLIPKDKLDSNYKTSANDLIEHSFRTFGHGNIDESHPLYHTLHDYTSMNPHRDNVLKLATHSDSKLISNILNHSTLRTDATAVLANHAISTNNTKQLNDILKHHGVDLSPHTIYDIYDKSDRNIKDKIIKNHGMDLLAGSESKSKVLPIKDYIGIANNKNVMPTDIVDHYHTHYAGLEDNHHSDVIKLIKNKLDTTNVYDKTEYFDNLIKNRNKYRNDVPELYHNIKNDMANHLEDNNIHDIIDNHDLYNVPEYHDFVLKHGSSTDKLHVYLHNPHKIEHALDNNTPINIWDRKDILNKYKEHPTILGKMLKSSQFIPEVAKYGDSTLVKKVYDSHYRNLKYSEIDDLNRFHNYIKENRPEELEHNKDMINQLPIN